MSRFTASKLKLELYEDANGRAILRDGRSQWLTDAELPWEVTPGKFITVPAGFRTDLASIPRVVSNIYPPDGAWVKAAVLHDYLYASKGFGVLSREQCDDIFRQAMAALGVSKGDRVVIWSAVRVGGWKGWGR